MRVLVLSSWVGIHDGFLPQQMDDSTGNEKSQRSQETVGFWSAALENRLDNFRFTRNGDRIKAVVVGLQWCCVGKRFVAVDWRQLYV